MASDVELRLVISAINNAGAGLNQVGEQLKAASSKAKALATSAAKVGTEGAEGARKLSSALERVKARLISVKNVSDKMISVGMQFGKIGASLAAAAFFPIAKAKSFEKAMSDVRAVTSGSKADFDALGKKVKDLGASTEWTAKQVAGGVKFLGMAGLSAKDALEAIGPALHLASAGGLELADSADIATNILEGLGLQTKKLNNVVDILAYTANNSNQSVAQLGESFSYAAPYIQQAGMSIKTASAMLGELADAGIRSTRGGTALRGIIIALSSVTPKAAKAFERLHVSILKNDDGTINYLGTLRALNKAGATTTDWADIFRRQFGGAAALLAKNADKTENFAKALDHVNGEAKKTAQVRLHNLWGELKKLTSAFSGLSSAMGSPLLKPLEEFVRSITKVVIALRDLAAENPKLAGAITGVIGALGALLTATAAVLIPLGMLGKLIVTVGEGLTTWIAISGSAVKSLLSLRDAMLATDLMASTVGRTIVALGLTMAALDIYHMIDGFIQWQEAEVEASNAAKRLQEQAARLVEKFKDFKNVKLPAAGEWASLTTEQLRKMDQELSKSILYWTGIRRQLEARSKEKTFWVFETEGARKAQAALKKVNETLAKYEAARNRERAQRASDTHSLSDQLKALEKFHSKELQGFQEKFAAEVKLRKSANKKMEAALNAYYAQKAIKVKHEVVDQGKMQKELIELEKEHYQKLADAHQKSFQGQLETEKSFTEKSIQLISEKVEVSKAAFGAESKQHLENVRKLNASLLRATRDSAERQRKIVAAGYKQREADLKGWRSQLLRSYSNAEGLVRSYGDKVKRIEKEITDLRKKGSEELASITETTEERILRARRAGMSEVLVLQDKIREANRKTAEADKLASEDSIKSQKRAEKIYSEVQGIWTDVAVAAQSAAKEGKDVGVSYTDSMEQVVAAGSKAKGAVQAYIRLQEIQKKKDEAAAKSSKAYWESVAKNLEKSLKAVAIAMSNLDETLRKVNGLAARTKDAIKDIGTAAKEVKVKSVIDVTSVKKSTATVKDLGKAYKKIPPVIDDTKASMDEMSASAVKSGNDITSAATSTVAATDKYADYSKEVEKAREKVEDLSKAGKDGEKVTAAQAHAAELYASKLEAEAKSLKDSEIAEERSLKAAKENLKIDKAELVVAKEKLVSILRSGNASKEEVAALSSRVRALKASVVASEKFVESQGRVADDAKRAADAMESEAKSARGLANSLGKVAVAARQMGAGLITAAGQATYATTDWASEISVLLDGVSKKAETATAKLSSYFSSTTSEIRKAEQGGIEVSNVKDLIALYDELAAKVAQHEEALRDSCKLFAHAFRPQVEAEEKALAIFKAFVDEASKVKEDADELDNLTASLDRTSDEYEKAVLAAADFKGQIGESIKKLKDMIAAAQDTIDNVQYLDESDLANLEGSIKRAKEELIALTKQAKKAREELDSIGRSLQDQLDRQLGNLTAIENRRYKDQVAEIKKLYEESGKSAKDLAAEQKALDLAEQLHREKMADALAEQKRKESADEKKLHNQKMKDLDEYMKKLEQEKSQQGSAAPKMAFASGGTVPGSGFGDSVLAMLTPGEFVLRKEAVDRLGQSFLNSLNAFKSYMPKFAGGGAVDSVLSYFSPGKLVLNSDSVKQLGLPFLSALNHFKEALPGFASGGLVGAGGPSFIPFMPGNVRPENIQLNISISGAGEITEKQVRRWIFPAIEKIQRLRR